MNEDLQRWFGIPDFRPGQAEAIEAFRAGRDVQVLLPTGGGKSLCYQIPALERWESERQATVGVPPLVALMDDQVAALRKRGIPAAALHSRRALSEAEGAALVYV